MATTLSAGAIAIIGYNTHQSDSTGNPPTLDSFSFLALSDLAAGTQIFFTDRNWNGSAFVSGAGEGTFSYTVGAGGIAAGTVITPPISGGFSLDLNGDQIYAYLGTDQNTPTKFLYAIDFADGNTTFNSSLANTGLTLGSTAVAVSLDSAAYSGPTTVPESYLANNTALLASIGDPNNWTGSNQTGQNALVQPVQTGPFLTAPDLQVWATESGGGNGIGKADGDATVGGGLTGFNITDLYTAAGVLFHPNDIVFDTVHGKFFIADSDISGGNNRVLQGNIADLLGNPGTLPTLTVLYSDTTTTTAARIDNLEVDPNSGQVYFTHGSLFQKVSYNTAGQTPTTLMNFGTGSGNPVGTGSNFFNDIVIDFSTGDVYLSSTRVGASASGDVVQKNYIYHLSGLTASSGAGAFSFSGGNASLLPFSPQDTTLLSPALPKQDGTIDGLALDTTNHVLYFATGEVILDDDGNSATPAVYHPGHIYSYNLTNNSTGIYTSIFTQTAQFTGPVPGLMSDLEIDPVTGRWYVTDTVGSNGSASDSSDGVWSGNLNGTGTPTVFANFTNINALTAVGITVDHAPTFTASGAATPTTTETVGLGSGFSPAVQPIANPTTTDFETSHLTDQLAGAVIRITTGFESGSPHQDQLTINGLTSGTLGSGISFTYNATSGVMTLSGASTFANYDAALNLVRFAVSGDNPTDYNTDTHRTVAWSVSDGLLSSDEQTTTVTVVGTNDAPVLSGAANLTFTETNAGLSASHALTVTDPDSTSEAYSTFSVIASGAMSGLPDNATLLSYMTESPSPVTLSAAATSNTTTYSFNSGSQAFNYLSASETLTLTYDIRATDNDLSGNGVQTADQVVTVTITGTNDAPVLTSTIPSMTQEDEDSPAPVNGQAVGTLVGALVGGVTDVDDNAVKGIAITGNSGLGTLWYSLDNGQTWQQSGAVSDSSALLLAADASTRIYLQPIADYNGTDVIFSFRAWDQTTGTAGTHANTSVNGGTTAFSTATDNAILLLNPVNDAPVVVNGTTTTLAAISEDTANPAGDTVANLFGSHFSDTADDQTMTTAIGGSDPNILAGIAITGNAASATQGKWQWFNGSTWADVTGVSNSNALVLDTAATLRFVPASNFNGTAPALTAHLIDNSSGAVTSGGTVDLSAAGATGGTTQYSSLTVGLGETVTAVNDAPVVVNGNTASAASFAEDGTPSTATITTLFGGHFDDSADNQTANGGSSANTFAGIAITANASALWEWSTDGASWHSISAGLTDATALVLAAGTQLRFHAAPNFNGTAPALTAHLIDSSIAVTNNTTVDLSAAGATGGTTGYSTGTVALSDTVTPVNDAPALTGLGSPVSATEQTAVLLGPAVTVSDIDLGLGGTDNYNGTSLTVARDSAANAEDLFSFATSANFTVSAGNLQSGGLTFATYTVLGGTLTVNFTGAGTTATKNLVNDVIDHIQYTNNSDTPPASVTLDYTFSDGNTGGQGTGGALSATASTTVNITAVNDAPVNTVPAGQTAGEDTAFIFSSGNGNAISVADVDAGGGSETVTLGVLHGTLTLSGETNLTVTGDGTGSVVLTGTLSDINTALNGLSYHGSANYNGGDTLTVNTNDNGHTGTGGSQQTTNSVAITVSAVNDAPSLTGLASPVSAIQQTAVLLGPGVTVSDIDLGLGGTDNYNGTSLTVARDSAANAEDLFSFASSANFTVSAGNLQSGGLTFATYTVSGGTLTINFTGAGTTATKDLVNDVIDHIQYTNNSDTPPASVTLDYTFNDGNTGGQGSGGALTATAATLVNITATDHAPVNTVPGAQTVDEDTALVFSSGNGNAISVADVDAGGGSETVTLGVLHGTLTLSSETNLTVTGDGTGSVVLTGTLSDINTALNGLSYQGSANYNGGDTLTVTTNDNGHTGVGGPLQTVSSVAITVSPVNDAPVLTGIGPGHGFTFEQFPAFLDGTANVSDVELDALNNYDGASLTIAREVGGVVTPNSEDTFGIYTFGASFTLTGGQLQVGGTTFGTFLSSGGTASLVFNSAATTALVNEVMQDIVYLNSSDNPPAQVNLHYTFSDGNTGAQGSGGPLTAEAVRTFDIAPVDDPPVIGPPGATLLAGATFTGTAGPGGTGALHGVSDPEGDPFVIEVLNGSLLPFDDTPLTVQGSYGHLSLQDDGAYTYVADRGLQIITAPDGSPIVDNFSITVGEAAPLHVAATNGTLAETVTLGPGGFENISDPTGSATFTLGATTLNINEATSTTYGGVIQDGTSGFHGGIVDVSGPGTLTLTGQSTFTGTYRIHGSLDLAGTGSIGANDKVALRGAGATFDISGVTGTDPVNIGKLAGDAGTLLELGGKTLWIHEIAGSAGSTTGTFAGTIEDGPNGTGGNLIIDGPGPLILTGHNTYTGVTRIDGTLKLSGNGSIADSLKVNLHDPGAVFDISGVTAPDPVSIGKFAGTTGTFVELGSHTLSIHEVAGPLGATTGTFWGTIEDGPNGTGGGLMVDGPGLLILRGQSTYTGGTVLHSGGLELAAHGAVGTGAVTFSAAATLTIDGAALTGSGNHFSFDNTIAGFTASDRMVDLTSLTYTGAATTATLNGNVLTVSNGVQDVAMTLSGANPGATFHVASDLHGGTFVFDPPASSDPAPLLAQHDLVATLGAAGAADQFVFHAGIGHETVGGYDPGLDTVNVQGSFANFDALMAHTQDDGHGNVLIADGADSMLLLHSSRELLAHHAADFHFA